MLNPAEKAHLRKVKIRLGENITPIIVTRK